ncbi:MAG: pseudouridine synthase [Leptospirillum sp.]
MEGSAFLGRNRGKSNHVSGHTVDRWISKLGLGTRGMAREWLRDGRLSLKDGVPIESIEQFIGRKGDREPDFLLDGRPLLPDRPVVLAFNKPRGVLVSRTDPQGRSTVLDALSIPPGLRSGVDISRIMPVGRLDMASAGLILLTNRPSLFAPLLDPRRAVPREYRVQIRPAIRQPDLESGLKKGVWAKELGFAPVDCRVESENRGSTWLRLCLVEGQNREIRRIFEYGGYSVCHLIRIRFGPFAMKDLPPGALVDITRWFFRDKTFLLDIILDRIRNGDIIELKEEGAGSMSD